MKKKLLIVVIAAIITVGAAVGATMAVFQASTSTDKTISTSSLDIALHIEGAEVSEAGDVIYTSEDIKDGTIAEQVFAENTGNKDMYVRVRINKAWYDDASKVFTVNEKEVSAAAIGVRLINTEDWIVSEMDAYGEDIYLYYRKPLPAGQLTSSFMDAFTLLQNVNGNTNQYTGLTAKMRFDAEAVQTTAASKAMVAEWGVIAGINKDGMIDSIRNQ